MSAYFATVEFGIQVEHLKLQQAAIIFTLNDMSYCSQINQVAIEHFLVTICKRPRERYHHIVRNGNNVSKNSYIRMTLNFYSDSVCGPKRIESGMPLPSRLKN